MTDPDTLERQISAVREAALKMIADRDKEISEQEERIQSLEKEIRDIEDDLDERECEELDRLYAYLEEIGEMVGFLPGMDIREVPRLVREKLHGKENHGAGAGNHGGQAEAGGLRDSGDGLFGV